MQEHTHINKYEHTPENTHTHTHTHTHTPCCLYKFLYSRVTQASHCLGILPLALDSSLSHSSSSKTSLLSSPSSSMLLSLPTVDDLICHKYFIVALRHELSLTFPPPIFKLSLCNPSFFSVSQELSFLRPKVKLPP